MDLLDSWFECIRNGNLKEIISIYKSNPDLINKFTTMSDGRNNYQTNAIIEASFQGNRDLVKWLIDNRADVHSTSDGGWKPIHFASQQGHVTTVNLLVLGGAEVNVETEAKETPIFLALQAYMRDTVKKLLHHGASLAGIDRNYLQICIQKDILDPSLLDEQNKIYLSTDSSNYRKIDSNGFDLINRHQHPHQSDREIEEIKPVKLIKTKIITEYDNELKRRRQELLKKMRRVSSEPFNQWVPLIRQLAQSDSDSERISIVKEMLGALNNTTEQAGGKFYDQMINILELSLCDSSSSDQFIDLTAQLIVSLLQFNVRRGDSPVIEFWCRIFDKMTNLQIEQYSLQILKMIRSMLQSAPDIVISHLQSSPESLLQNFEYFFENLCFPKCLNLSLIVLQLIHTHCPVAVSDRFHNVIDIMIGWCIHSETDDSGLRAELCARSSDLQACWLSNPANLRKTISNLQKDIFSHCQSLSRFHRIDKDRQQIDELKLKIKHFCFALSCVTAGISRISDISSVDFVSLVNDRNTHQSELVSNILSNSFIIGIIDKLTNGLMNCNKQIDFDSLLLQSNTIILHLLSILNPNESHGSIYQIVLQYVLAISMPISHPTSVTHNSLSFLADSSNTNSNNSNHNNTNNNTTNSATSTATNNNMNNAMNYYNRQLILSCLDLITISFSKITLDSSMIVQILSPLNWIHSCLFYRSSIDNRLLEKYLKLVDIVSRSQFVTTLYQILLSDLELAINTLIDTLELVSPPASPVRLVQSNAFKSKSYDPGHAELVIKYNINLIRLLHHNNVSLVPPVPVLFARYLLFTDRRLIEKYPSLSSFIMDKVSQILHPTTSIESSGSDLQSDFIRFLCLIFKISKIDLSIKQRAFAIFQQQINFNRPTNRDLILIIIDSLATMIDHHEVSPESIIQDSLELIIDFLNNIKTANTLQSPAIYSRLLQQSIRFSLHHSHSIRQLSLKLYFQLASFSQSQSNDQFNQQIKSVQSIMKFGRSFKFPLDFSKSIFNWIIESVDETSFSSGEFIRLNNLLCKSIIDDENNTNTDDNQLCSVYRLIMSACWDCIRQKLRFDQISDSRSTLLTIENMVRSILSNGQSSKSITDRRFRKLVSVFSSKSALNQCLSVNLMIVFIDLLEKLFYNSYEGCCIGLPPVNKSTETFFVANRQVCVEWFLKMRLLMIALAQYSGQWSSVVWHALQLLHSHLDNAPGPAARSLLPPELEDCIVLLAMAYSKLGSSDSLIGLYRLSLDRFGQRFEWIDALADKTEGRLEQAVEKFESYIRTHHDPDRLKQHATAVASNTGTSTANAANNQSSEMRLLTRKSTSHSSFILCMEEIADCHKILSNTAQLTTWKSQLDQWKSNSQMIEAQKSTINWNRLICLTKLSTWNNNDDNKSEMIDCLNQQKPELTWKYRSMIDHCEDNLYLAALERNKSSPIPVSIESLMGNIASIQSISDFPSSLTNPDLILINERLKLIKSSRQSPQLLSRFSSTICTVPVSIIGFSNLIMTEKDFSNQKFLIKWHRKHSNFSKCHNLIDQSLKQFLSQSVDQSSSDFSPLSHSQSPIIQMQLERELVKLLWQQNRKSDALRLLTNSLKENLLFETSDSNVHSSKCRLNTKSLLRLFWWLSQDSNSDSESHINQPNISTNLQFLIDLAEVPWINGLPLVSPQHRSQSRRCHSSLTDICTQLLILASKSRNQDNDDNKSFIALAHWCLSRSRALDESGINSISSISDRLLSTPQITENNNNLSIETASNIELLFKSNFTPSKMISESDWFGDCYEDHEYLSELRSSILALDPEITDEIADKSITIWCELIQSHFSLHVSAADAYFSFLKDASSSSVSSNNSIDRNRTTANLRILSLLGKRSRSLRNTIIAKIKTSPPGAWTNVIPQLFARLKHSDQSVRTCMVELLQRLALVPSRHWTNLIIYPSLVGAINEADNPRSPYHDIRQVLMMDNHRAVVDETGLFIKELRRITVLWDELWVSALGQCHEELNKKASQMQMEIEKIDCYDNIVTNNNNSTNNNKKKDVILKLKYNSIVQAAVFILERTQMATQTPPETPRECWFHNMFANEITNLIEEIKSPHDIRQFNDAWKKVKDLQELILTESNNNIKAKVKRNRHHFLSLKLDEVSPSLAKINTSLIPLPGMNDKELVSIDSHISILPTKTKPKKFRFLSTDGKKYSYLYKGLEDLRLDERVMQILGIANTMFSKINEHESNKYHITTYPVTPLGTRAGLIQMVEEATSLFSLYKRHQMRNKSTYDFHKSRIRHSNNVDTNEATIVSEEGHPIRPTDIYWQKLRPKLEAAKLDISFDNRDKWPLSILIEVLTELSKETPSDLLSKELWCCSINSSNWFKSSINFTRSCAVMSVMGHILGLGDRHLDNLLVNFSTGQMIHIDYNVCFDKGVSLKVPEKVPFRLTDIITYVFGPMSVEGVFKISCEKVYEIIQQSRDSILTLMDTFIFDPIVDWSSGIECGHYGSFDGGKYAVNSNKSIIEKRSVEFLINLNNFQSVLVTIEDDLKICPEKLAIEFTNLHENLRKTWKICQNIEQIRSSHNKKQEIIEYLNNYEHNQDRNIIQQYNHIRSLEERSSNLEIDIKSRLQQLKSIHTEHSLFFNKILSPNDFISLKLDIKNIKIFSEEHLSNIQKSTSLFLDQCVGFENQNSVYQEVINELATIVHSIDSVEDNLMVVEKYRNIIQEMPHSYFNNDRCSFMLQITEKLSKNPSLSNISDNLKLYSNWVNNESEQNSSIMEQFIREKDNWSWILKTETECAIETQKKIVLQSQEDEIKELEAIWQLTIFENVAGINMFKAILLEQYLEMANVTSQLDASLLPKIPESISLHIDYNNTLRKYVQLLNAHENYFKILSNLMSMFGLYFNNESVMVFNMMSGLQKACLSILSFESKFIEIIMPESIKIMKKLSPDDLEILDQLKSIVKDGENIMLHFNIAFTSASYDIKNYENIHLKIIPIKEKLAKLTDISNISIQDTTKQLRILIASFYTTIGQTYNQISELIDLCMSSSTPSSWNYIDLVAASSHSISPMWNKSIMLLKDALYMSGLSCLINSLDQCKSVSDLIPVEQDSSSLISAINNIPRNVETYFNFINKHIIVGVGSQCFGKMFCLLLEHAGWNIDALIADNSLHSNLALNAEFICGSAVSFRKSEYPNANNFYSQLQYRFNNYKSIMGILSSTTDLSQKFLCRNLAFHKSLGLMARNQLTSHCWSKRHFLTRTTITDHKSTELGPLFDLIDILDGIPNRLEKLKNVLTNLELISVKFQSIDDGNEVIKSMINTDQSMKESLNKIAVERTQSINSLKKRILMVSDVLQNIDRFECLRSRSTERGTRFDEEVIEFLSDSEDLLTKLSQCDGLIKPIEEDIIRLKQQHRIEDHDDDGTWWIDLSNILTSSLQRSSNEITENEAIAKEIVESFEKDGKNLKENLSIDYYSSINSLKPSLRVLNSVTKKLKIHLSLDDSISISTAPARLSIRARVDRVIKLTGLLERFNYLIDGVVKFLCKSELSPDFSNQLHLQLTAVESLKDSIVPELFSTLLSLSPLEIAAATDDKSSPNSIYDSIDLQSKFGFSNNNMAETNGDVMNRISPSLSGEDDFPNIIDHRSINQSSTTTAAAVNDPLDNANKSLMATTINKDSLIPNNNSTTIATVANNNNININKSVLSNTVGVQRAIEVWKLMETRLNPATIIDKSKPSSSAPINQYIDKLIKSARSPENLARMYEGWTAWV